MTMNSTSCFDLRLCDFLVWKQIKVIIAVLIKEFLIILRPSAGPWLRVFALTLIIITVSTIVKIAGVLLRWKWYLLIQVSW